MGGAARVLRAAIGSALVGLLILVINQIYILAYAASAILPMAPVRELEGASGEAAVRRRHSRFKPAIPRKIHLLWRSLDFSDYPITPSLSEWRDQYGSRGWDVRLWTDDDVEELISREYPSLKALYHSYPYAVQRADIARLMVVDHEGGVYVDCTCMHALSLHDHRESCTMACDSWRYSRWLRRHSASSG
jgi:mannosyltransferase OCH1-like enzyme